MQGDTFSDLLYYHLKGIFAFSETLILLKIDQEIDNKSIYPTGASEDSYSVCAYKKHKKKAIYIRPPVFCRFCKYEPVFTSSLNEADDYNGQNLQVEDEYEVFCFSSINKYVQCGWKC